MSNWDNLSMRDKRDVMRLHIKNGIRDLDGIRESYNSFGDGGFTQRTDAIQSYAPRDRFKPIPISQEQQFNLKNFGQFNRPEQRQQTIQQPSNIKESQESKRLAEERINTRERLQKFEEQERIDKERELKVAPYAVMGLVGAATGTLPAIIAGEIGGRTVDYGSKKLTGKSWGENVLPEAPIIGELINPGYLAGGLSWIKSIKNNFKTNSSIHNSIGGNFIENNRDITPTFWQDMHNSTRNGILDSRKTISDPIVQNTIFSNQKTYQRLRPNAYNDENIGQTMVDLSKRKIIPKFTEIDNKTSGQLIDWNGDTVEGNFNTQAWNALKPLSHHEATGYHEGLHIGKFGSHAMARDKVNRLYKPEAFWESKDNASYILDNVAGEGVVNTYEMGKRAGLNIGQPYIGKENFKTLLENTNFGTKTDFAKMFKLDTDRDYKRVWDAMTGKYFIIPATAVTGYQLSK